MKKIVLIIFMLVFALCICSCDNSTNNNDDDKKQDSSLDGIDLSLYEMPQTEFLQDGHTLTRLEEVMKFVIFEGTFIYERHLNSIGYRYILEETEDSMLYAYYWIDELRLVHLTTVGKVAHMSYIKLTETSDNLTVCHKIQYYSGWRQDFYAIMNCERAKFDSNYVGEYDLYRGYTTQSKEEITTKVVSQNYNLLNKFNAIITEKINIILTEFGYNCE